MPGALTYCVSTQLPGRGSLSTPGVLQVLVVLVSTPVSLSGKSLPSTCASRLGATSPPPEWTGRGELGEMLRLLGALGKDAPCGVLGGARLSAPLKSVPRILPWMPHFCALREMRGAPQRASQQPDRQEPPGPRTPENQAPDGHLGPGWVVPTPSAVGPPHKTSLFN